MKHKLYILSHIVISSIFYSPFTRKCIFEPIIDCLVICERWTELETLSSTCWVISCAIPLARKSFPPVTAPCGTIKRLLHPSMCSCAQGECVLHIGDLVCDDYWVDFQSSWSWGPTGSQRGAGTRITTTSCFLCWMTRSPATSCTASTPRMPWATSGSSSLGLLTSLRCAVLNNWHYTLGMQKNTRNNILIIIIMCCDRNDHVSVIHQ